MLKFLNRMIVKAGHVQNLEDLVVAQRAKIKELEGNLHDEAARPDFYQVAATVDAEAVRQSVIERVVVDMAPVVKGEALHALERFMRMRSPMDQTATMQWAARREGISGEVHVIEVNIPSMHRRLEVML